MFNSILYTPEKKVVLDIERTLIKEILSKPDNFLWIDLYDPTDKEIVVLSEDFQFHELSIEDCIFPQNQSKFDKFDKYHFIVIFTIKSNGQQMEDVETTELNIFLGGNFIVTVHDDAICNITALLERCKQNPELMSKGADFLLHRIIDEIVDGYLPIIEELEDQIDIVEDEILKKSGKETMSQIFFLRKKSVALRKKILPLIGIVSALSHPDSVFITPDVKIYFKDIYDHIIRIRDMLETYREVTISLLEVYLSNVSTKLNESMKLLTIIATIFMPLTFITSYYGMNIYLPEVATWGTKAFPFVWCLLIGSVLGMVFFLRHKRGV